MDCTFTCGTLRRALYPLLTASLAPVLLYPTLASAGDWVIETVDAPKMFSGMADRSLRLDAAGNPHVAYGDDHLYYAWYDGIDWSYVIVDSSRLVGSHASLLLDGGGTPHFAYYDAWNRDLKYAVRNGNSWQTETVDSTGDVGTCTSVGVDSSGCVHISYFDQTTGAVKYARRDGGGWQAETVDDVRTGLSRTSLAIASGGIPHIGYRRGDYGDWPAKHVWRDASGWHVEIVDSVAYGAVSLQADAQGRVHLAYARGLGGNRYAFRDSSGWHTEWTPHWGFTPSLDLDADGFPHIVGRRYVVQGFYSLAHAYKDSLGWHLEDAPPWGYYLSITGVSVALDSIGRVHVSCREAPPNELRYYAKSDSTWHEETVDRWWAAGQYSSLALDNVGLPHIGYTGQGQTTNEVRYARACGAGWTTETAVPGSPHTAWTSLALDDSAYPHVAYERGHYTRTTFYARKLAHQWVEELVGDYQPSLAVDHAGRAHMSLYTGLSGGEDLVYALREGAGWQREVVDAQGDVGRFNSLALDRAGRPHISYFDYTRYDLKYARRDASGWRVETAYEGGGAYTSLALDAAGYPHVGHYDSWGGELEYTWRDVSGWSTETVDCASLRERGISLALDRGGMPRVGYYDWFDTALKYAWKDASGWHVEVVDSAGDVGAYCSLAVDQYGRPHISYYDATMGDLKCAVGQPSAMYLAGRLQAGQLRLTWNPWPNTAAYWVYGASNLTYFTPGLAPGYQHRLAVLSPLFQTWSSPNGIGDPNDNWTYLVLAVDASDQELIRSNRVGEWDFAVIE
jgi:hypothetical protein